MGRPAFSGQRNWSYFMLHADRATPARSLRWPGGQLGDRPVLGLKTLPTCSHNRRQQAQDHVAGMQDQRLVADVPVVRVHAAPAAGRKSGTKSRGGSPWAMTASRVTQGRVTR